MDIQAQARAAFAIIKTMNPSCVVPVSYAGRTCNGILDTRTATASLGPFGEAGVDTGSVLVDASELDVPSKGATLTVNGKAVFCMVTAIDPAGALLEIQYQAQKPTGGA
jgi:hypothetical protein